MRNELIDTLTRVIATPAPSRSTWRTVATVATTGFWTLIGRSLVQPSDALASVDAGLSCYPPNADGTCPPDTSKRPRSGNVPTSNGCGPEGGAIKIPQGYGKADYTGSCNTHDVCYEDCGKDKVTCDEEFRDDMYSACAAAYPGKLNALWRLGCYERAFAYYQAVLRFGGGAWSAAQQKACECCDETTTQFYCNCNKSCYDDLNVCLNECQVTLGCFTGICGPATEEQCPA